MAASGAMAALFFCSRLVRLLNTFIPPGPPAYRRLQHLRASIGKRTPTRVPQTVQVQRSKWRGLCAVFCAASCVGGAEERLLCATQSIQAAANVSSQGFEVPYSTEPFYRKKSRFPSKCSNPAVLHHINLGILCCNSFPDFLLIRLTNLPLQWL